MFIQPQHKDSNRSSGFTIVELMIATVVFSMVLMVCSYAIIHVGRMYYKGVIMSRTQDTSRKIVDRVVDSIKYSKENTKITGSSGDTQSICLGSSRYSYVLGQPISGSRIHALWWDNSGDGACAPLTLSSDTPSYPGEELLADNMRLVNFSIEAPNGTDLVWRISVTVSYGEDGDFEEISVGVPNYNLCKGVIAGGQFCAVSSYSTTVKSRL